MQLVAVYLEALQHDGLAPVDRAGLADTLATSCHLACGALPGLEPSLPDFVRWLAERSRDGAPPSPEHAGDLAIAFAARRGDEAALRALDAVLVSSVARAVAHIDSSQAFADLVAQELRTHLLVGERPRIEDYAGRGPLRAWLRTAAARVALNLRRGSAERGRRMLSSGLRTPADDPEIVLLRTRHRGDFEDALRAALARLPRRERAALCLNVRDGMSSDKLATLYGVSRATAKRLLANARTLLFAETRRELQERLGLTPSEFKSVARVLHGEIEVSVARLLQETASRIA
jgi:RNA polymerase sigma-70 factor (ECF subfamily)